jgi:hypothetical protein
MFLLPIGILFAPVFFVVPAVSASSLLLAVPSASIHTIAKVPAVADVRELLHALLVLHSPLQWKTLMVFSFVPALLCIPAVAGLTADDGTTASFFFKAHCLQFKNLFYYLHQCSVDKRISVDFRNLRLTN